MFTQTLNEAIGGITVIRVFGGHDYERERFQRETNWVRRYQLKFASSAAAVAPFAQLATAMAAAIILYAAASRALSSGINPGRLRELFHVHGPLVLPDKTSYRCQRPVAERTRRRPERF